VIRLPDVDTGRRPALCCFRVNRAVVVERPFCSSLSSEPGVAGALAETLACSSVAGM
jgi:hypothetical protein